MMYRRVTYLSLRAVAAALCAAVMAGCSASADNAASDCSLGACEAPTDAAKVSDSSPSPRAEAAPPVDAGPTRNLLCGMSGCDPGNVSACGVPVVDGGPYGFPTSDASDAGDSASTEGGSDSSASDADAASTPGQDAAKHEVGTGASIGDGGARADTPEEAIDATDAARNVMPDASYDSSVSFTPVPSDGAPVDGAFLALADARPDTSAEASTTVTHDAASDTGVADEPKIVEGCYLKPSASGIVSACAPIGARLEGESCQDSSDCASLLACVAVDGQTACRQLRCELPPICAPGTFYQEVPLSVQGVARTDYLVPVCLPNDACMLLAEVNPCPENEVCTIVGSKGETSCAAPGAGRQGDSCQDTNRCAEGLVCSKFYNKCLKVCHLEASAECGSGACQGGNNSLPAGFGICVGDTDGG